MPGVPGADLMLPVFQVSRRLEGAFRHLLVQVSPPGPPCAFNSSVRAHSRRPCLVCVGLRVLWQRRAAVLWARHWGSRQIRVAVSLSSLLRRPRLVALMLGASTAALAFLA